MTRRDKTVWSRLAMWIGYNAKRICSTFTCAVLQKQHQTLLIIVEWPHVTSTWPSHVTSPAANQRNEESSREREKATVYSRQCQSESSSSTLHARWNEQWSRISIDVTPTALPLTLTCDLDLKSPASYGHDPYTSKRSLSKVCSALFCS